MRSILILLAKSHWTLSFFCIAATLFYSTPVFAAGEVPLAIIRFNQTRVFYEQQLFKAVSAAVQTKPNVIFDVVSFIPKSNGDALQSDVDSAAKAQSERVVSSLKKMGIISKNIYTSKEHDPAIRDHEIQIFVR